MFSTLRFPHKFNGVIKNLATFIMLSPTLLMVSVSVLHTFRCTAQTLCMVFTFCFHFLASENALEELLTVYTKTNKSAALFLGTRSESEPESGKGSRRQQISDRSFLGDVEYQEPVVPKSETWRDILKQSSDDRGSLLLSDRYNRSLAATSVNTSPYATSANVNPYASQNQRPMSAYSRLRETAG